MPLASWTAIFTLLSIGVTWPLWFRTTEATFPQTPLTVALVECPQFVDYGLSILLVVSLFLGALVLKLPRIGRIALLSCTANMCLLVALDQQRLQPWLYHAGLVCLAFGACTPLRAKQLCRILVISIYAYSAIGKFDFEFLHSVGPNFVGVLLSWAGVLLADLSASTQTYLTLALPVAESCLAFLLVIPLTRRLGGRLAVAFHLVLALVFSPLGLNHSLSVIVWNLQFAVQAWLLFVRSEPIGKGLIASSNTAGTTLSFYPVSTIFALAILLPIGERFGRWDHWLSWALYAPHSSRAEVFVANSAVERLPERLQELVENPDSEPGTTTTLWLRVPVKQWCLDSSYAPAYPQARSGVAAAWEMRRMLDTDFEVKLKVLGIANRFTGQRSSLEIVRPEDFRRLSQLFWINTLPRKTAGDGGDAG